MEPLRLQTTSHSDSSCEESIYPEVFRNHVPSKPKSSTKDVGKKHDHEHGSDLQLHFHGRKNFQLLDESEFTDKSSDSYVPKLLSLPKKTSKSPLDLHRSDPRRGVAYRKTKGEISYQSESSSDSEPSRAAQKIRAAWDRKYHRKNLSRKETKIRESVTLPKSKINTESLLPKPRASILKKTALPKPPSSSENYNMHYSVGTPGKPQSRSGSSYQSTSFPHEGLVRPAVTERLLKASQDDIPTGSSKKDSSTYRHSRATPDVTLAPPLKNLSSEASLKTSARQSHDDQSVPMPSKQSKQNERQTLNVTSKQIKHIKHIEVNQPINDGGVSGSVHPCEDTASKSESLSASSKRIPSQIVSDVFRRRSIVGSGAQSENSRNQGRQQKEPLDKNKSAKKPELESGSIQTESSTQSLVSAVRKIAPTKKRVFNVDIGQGINVVTYLKESAPGANVEKQKTLVDLLVTPVEIKKAPTKPTSALRVESSKGILRVPSSERHASRSTSMIKYSSPRKSLISDDMPVLKRNFKTLDQIYKEVHGINLHNTPAVLIENEYEHEAKKRQQLTKHRLSP